MTALSGAPLDLIKAAAAFFMVLDHTDTILLLRANVWLFRFGRIAMPLFCFAVAAHVVRDREHRGRSIVILLAFAAATQPIFSWAFQTTSGSVLITLAIGGALGALLPSFPPVLRHALLAIALLACWVIPNYANTASDYGVAGMMFPATIALTVLFGLTYLPWAVAFGATLNAFPHADVPGWWVEPAIDAAFALLGGAAVVALAMLMARVPRFLPRYALHVFYPGHLALLALIRAVLPH